MQPFIDSGTDAVPTEAEHAAAFEALYAQWTSGWEDLQDIDLGFGWVTLCRSGADYQVLRFWAVVYAPIAYYKTMVAVDYQGSSAKAAIDAMFKAADRLTD